MSYHITDTNSSLIEEAEYDEDKKLLFIKFRPHYFLEEIVLFDVEFFIWEQFSRQDSLGKYYLQMLKPFYNYKSTNMADKTPKGINQSSDQTRFIKISIDTSKIKKEWINSGEKGNYLNITLMLMPDGEVDQYNRLGMVTQDVPRVIYEKEKGLDKSKKTKGPILGNGMEFPPAGFEGTPGTETGKLIDEKVMDDLPF